MLSINSARVGVIGLGYVGLPLALAFGREFHTIGFDIDAARVDALRRGDDQTGEATAAELAEASRLELSDDPRALDGCNVFIVTVPTPVDEATRPDLRPLEQASAMIGARCHQLAGL